MTGSRDRPPLPLPLLPAALLLVQAGATCRVSWWESKEKRQLAAAETMKLLVVVGLAAFALAKDDCPPFNEFSGLSPDVKDDIVVFGVLPTESR